MKKFLSFYLKSALAVGLVVFVPPTLFIAPAFLAWHYTGIEWLVKTVALLGIGSLFLFYIALTIKVDEYDGWF